MLPNKSIPLSRSLNSAHSGKVFHYLLSALTSLMFIIFSPACNALSQPVTTGAMLTVEKTYTLDQLGWDKSVTLNGYKPSYTFNMRIAKSMRIQKATLHLNMTYSPNLSSQTMVYIKLNNDIIRGLPVPAGQNNQATWDVELPVEQLSHDWQALTFSAYLYSTDNLCSPTVWIYISPESTITLSYAEHPFNGTLNQLPYPFVDVSALETISTLLVLPAAPSQQDIISLFKVAERLGEVSADYKVLVSTEFIDNLQLEQKKQNNLLLIGESSNLFEQAQAGYPWPYKQENNLFVDATQTPLKNNPGLIMLAQSPWNPTLGIMSITGNDDVSLNKAVSAFLLSEFKSLASGQTAIIDNINVSNELTQTIDWHHTTFKDLGYSDQSVSGLGTHTLSYNIALPNNRLPGYMTIKTQLAYPIFRDRDLSEITLVINGVKQSSLWLTDDHASWSVDIPSSALKPGKNTLDYIIDLHLDAERCSRQNYDQIWAGIRAESTLETSFLNDFPTANLNQFPVPFNTTVTIILPNKLSKNETKMLARLFFKFGMIYQNSAQYIDIRTSEQVDINFIQHHNVILVGTPETNSWIALLMDAVPVQINEEARILNTQEKHMVLSDKDSVGLLELIQSPWAQGKSILFITGNNEESLIWAIKTLADDKRRSTLKGNIALIHSDQSISTLTIYNNNYIGRFRLVMKKTITFIEKTVYFFKDNPQVMVYILVFLISVAVYIRRKNKH